MNKREIIKRLKNIAGHAVYTVGEEPFVMSLDDGIAVHEAIELLEKLEPLTNNEQAIDYLRETGWLQNHDRILTESKIVMPVQPKRGKWISYSQFYPEVNTHWVKWECSECGYVRTKGWEGTTDGRCPTAMICENCGAIMEKGEANVIN